MSERKPKRQPPWLLCWTATEHGVARVKSGPKGERDLFRILCDLSDAAGHARPQKTMAGGWIVSLPVIDYLRQYARQHSQWILVREWQR